ncbi:ComEC/Rec2 family competence protein [Pseudonocardia sp. CA-107938]|uniref:ComEC/Rec2 family competence protein n=1 Tax=Pseudonocardia sp. CA-107938 TaxID=3240021 RepID=UPI003D8E428C
MLAVEMLPAGHGDALVVEYGTAADPHRILVDAGTFHAWDGVRAELLRRRNDRYEVFVITHVDEDHIGGALALLDDPDLRHRVDHVWFNGYVHCASGGNVLGPVNGEQLTRRIVTGGFHWNEGFTPRASAGVGGPVGVPRNGPLPAVNLPGGACAVLLSPTGAQLKRLAPVWQRVVVAAHLVAGAGAPGHTGSPRPHVKHVPPLPNPLDHAAITCLAAKNAADSSEANGSSIAFVVEHGGKRVLMGADAHAPVLAGGLQRYAARVGEPRPRFDLVKLAHHGSNANISTALLDLIDCRRFLVSTNGDNFAHPDDAALAKIIEAYGGGVTFYCNYRTGRTEPWALHGPGVGATVTFPRPGKQALRVVA